MRCILESAHASQSAVWRPCPIARSVVFLRRSDMAAGDAQRVWFPEMIEILRPQWHQGMSFDTIIELSYELDATLQGVRSERHIHSSVLRCPQCGHVGDGAELHVSVRATILSLNRFCIATAGQSYALEKGWASYRKQNGLDFDVKSMASPPTQVASCVPSTSPLSRLRVHVVPERNSVSRA